MRNRILPILAGLFVLAGCAQDIAPEKTSDDSDFLVLKAECPAVTRTDMTEGNSTWEAGDKITVVYDGAAYEYIAESAGETTTFTSAAGIASYDPAKSLVAYYPATDVTGTIKVESEKALTFKEGTQTNTSCAPLVGTPKDDNLQNGALSVVFSNVFSVLDLDRLCCSGEFACIDAKFENREHIAEHNAEGAILKIVRLWCSYKRST